jgi:hypothetical protein
VVRIDRFRYPRSIAEHLVNPRVISSARICRAIAPIRA